MKKFFLMFVSILFILSFISCSFSSEYEEVTSNPDNPSISPDDDIPNIPEIIGAPEINTDSQFISEYESIYARIVEGGLADFLVTGPSGMGFDIIELVLLSFYDFEDYLEENGIEAQNGQEFDLGSGLKARINGNFLDENFSFDFAWSQYSFFTKYGTFTVWGNSTYHIYDDGNRYGLDVKAIIDLNGKRFSFVSDNLSYPSSDKHVLTGNAEINGDVYYIYCSLP